LTQAYLRQFAWPPEPLLLPLRRRSKTGEKQPKTPIKRTLIPAATSRSFHQTRYQSSHLEVELVLSEDHRGSVGLGNAGGDALLELVRQIGAYVSHENTVSQGQGREGQDGYRVAAEALIVVPLLSTYLQRCESRMKPFSRLESSEQDA
jgi:hypothetical protein